MRRSNKKEQPESEPQAERYRKPSQNSPPSEEIGERGWRSDAIERYLLVWEIDPEARNSPTMLPDLLRLTTHRSAGRRAAQVVTTIYGRTALPAIEAALAEPDITPLAQRELERLRGRLDAL